MSTNVFNPADMRRYPERWPRYRGKQLFEEIDDRSETGEEELLSVSHITGITPRNQKNVTMFKSESLVGYKRCQVGDIAANTMWTWQGAIGVSQYAGVVSPAYNVYRQRGNFYNPRFLDLLLREPSLVDVYHSLSTGIRPSRLRLYPKDFLTIDFPLPTKEEQDLIVAYLDERLTKIMHTIRTLEAEVADLEELQNNLVKDLVLRGNHRSRTTCNADAKWFDSLPSEWNLRPIKRMFKVISGGTPSSSNPEFWDGDINWLTPADYKTSDHYVSSGSRNITTEGLKSCNATLVPPGSIIFSKRAPIGTVAISSSELCTSQGCLACIPNRSVFAPYYYYLMSALTEEFQVLAPGTTFNEISATTFCNLKIPYPPLEEQEAISSILDDSCASLQSLIGCKNAQIDKLRELARLITSQAVTGKTNVFIPTPVDNSAGLSTFQTSASEMD